MSALSEALNKANEHDWSSREISRRAGGRIHHATVANFMRGRHAATPGDEVLSAFADVFPSLSLERLRELAGSPAGESDPYEPPPESDRLNARQRKAVDEVIRSMVALEGGSLFTARVEGEAAALGISVTRYAAEFEFDFIRARRARITELRPELDRFLSFSDGDVSQAADMALDDPDTDPLVCDLLLDAQAIVGASESVVLAAAARRGEPRLRGLRGGQDVAGEAPDPDGPEHGA
ncbi:hypothetical protein [Nocardioides sp. LML1-1-1.1]|uniref:hypothetical protein n=1 Tax=Nocardioides sp. LML1-1-1.1 TaxID=3135248 RepID=UPI00343CA330